MNAAILPTMVASDQGRIPVLEMGPYLAAFQGGELIEAVTLQ